MLNWKVEEILNLAKYRNFEFKTKREYSEGDFRRTNATMYVENGGNLFALQQLMGNKKLEKEGVSLNRYALYKLTR